MLDNEIEKIDMNQLCVAKANESSLEFVSIQLLNVNKKILVLCPTYINFNIIIVKGRYFWDLFSEYNNEERGEKVTEALQEYIYHHF